MALEMKNLIAKNPDELREEHAKLQKEILDLRLKHATRQLLDSAAVGRAKRDLARVNTVLRQKAVQGG